ncbi:hypothetical protein B7486_01980 [cyanobacterium TDX16]|nr:hypothetical protein B7486_01980 [cyanobacterium TDX16]
MITKQSESNAVTTAKEDNKALHAPDLRGKTVLIVGSRYFTRPKREFLLAAGATVVYTEQYAGDGLTRHEDAASVTQEILSLERKPDVVLVHHPRLDLYEGPFAENPVIRLARDLKVHNIPMVILDNVTIDAAKTVAARDAGATLLSMSEVSLARMPGILARVIGENEARRGRVRGR